MALVVVIALVVKPPGSLQDGAVPPIEKFALEISKNIFPTAVTLIRHCDETLLGTVIVSDPSFAVLPINVIGKLFPPSVDNNIATFVQLTGATLVEFTLHVTVCGSNC